MRLWRAILVVAAALPPARAAETIPAAPVKIIFDSDYETDCDDPGALAVLHALADNGEAEILVTVTSSRHVWSPAAIDVVNTYYGRPDLPIGATKTGPSAKSCYTKAMAARFPHDTGTTDQVPDAVDVYRQALAAQSDGSVVIVTVGYTTNIEDLLKSSPDKHSPLTGGELVRRKVKTWVCMGGNFFGESKTDPNLRTDAAATIYAVCHWPSEITFVGREIGSNPSPIRAGRVLGQTPMENPVRAAYEVYLGSARNHHCADLTTVLFAVRGLGDRWDIETRGFLEFTDDKGGFVWRKDRDERQNYLIPKEGYANRKDVMDELDTLLAAPPRLPKLK